MSGVDTVSIKSDLPSPFSRAAEISDKFFIFIMT